MARPDEPVAEGCFPWTTWNHRQIAGAVGADPAKHLISLPPFDQGVARAVGRLESTIYGFLFSGVGATIDVEVLLVDRAGDVFLSKGVAAGNSNEDEIEVFNFSMESYLRIDAVAGGPTDLTIYARAGRTRW